MPSKKTYISSGTWSKMQNGDQNQSYSLPDCNILPFFKGFKKWRLKISSGIGGSQLTEGQYWRGDLSSYLVILSQCSEYHEWPKKIMSGLRRS